jgi:Putative transposase
MDRLRQAPVRPRLSGRYTHRVAIGNSRLLACENSRFRWKDYRANNKCKVMTLDADEFIRRFLLHTLPKGFRRIRHFGIDLCPVCAGRMIEIGRWPANLRRCTPFRRLPAFRPYMLLCIYKSSKQTGNLARGM